jgi:hypothetical protein
MTDHPDAAVLALFVQGELTDAASGELSAHVASCAACAEALAGEARVEVALGALGGRPARPRLRAGRVAALAAAAAVVLAVVAVRDGGPVGSSIAAGEWPSGGVICASGADQAACVRRAHHHGLFVQYPSWAGPPPLGRAPGGGPSSSPFEGHGDL